MVYSLNLTVDVGRESTSGYVKASGVLSWRRGQGTQLRRPARWVASHRTTTPRRKTKWMDIDATRVHITAMAEERKASQLMGFCLDIGAPRSVIDVKELTRIFSSQGLRTPELSKHSFKIGSVSQTQCSILSVKYPSHL